MITKGELIARLETERGLSTPMQESTTDCIQMIRFGHDKCQIMIDIRKTVYDLLEKQRNAVAVKNHKQVAYLKARIYVYTKVHKMLREEVEDWI
jgi:hypothetical protein